MASARSRRSVRKAIASIAGRLDLVAVSPPPTRNSTFADILEDDPQGVRWHTEAETNRLLGMMSAVNLAKVEAAKRSGKRMVGGLYRRTRDVQRAEICFDDVAGCLRTPAGGSSRQTIIVIVSHFTGKDTKQKSALS